MPQVVTFPKTLTPYQFHGLKLNWQDGKDQALADCPWCGKPGKFSIEVSTGKWRCWSCATGSPKGGGNSYTFIRELLRTSKAGTPAESLEALAEGRKLLYDSTLTDWGVALSATSKKWILPGYNTAKEVAQLYKWSEIKEEKRILFSTPEMGHGLFGLNLWDDSKEVVWIFEGPWDGMAAMEVLQFSKLVGSSLVFTSDPSDSLAASVNVIAVPGCNTWLDSWTSLVAGKHVVILFDSDHPKEVNGVTRPPSGYEGLTRLAHKLHSAPNPPSSIAWLRWGPEGYDPQLPAGYDVRDSLTATGKIQDRVVLLDKIIQRIEPWVQDDSARAETSPAGRSTALAATSCSSWKDLISKWKKAMRWRQDLDDVFSVMLAVCVSTDQVGDQLFLQVIGDAGSGKTRLCDGMLVSNKCFALEHLTGFHSGWKDSSGEDYSLLARINHKTLITPEGDVLMSSPRFIEIMSQQRRIFDGTSGASYKNRAEDIRYTGLRTPWIMAGTFALLSSDQSRLGDRFLRVCIDPPDQNERQEILRRVAFTAMRSVLMTSDSTPESCVEEDLRDAYTHTGGYVDWLRANASELLASVKGNTEELAIKCATYGEYAAFCRARPDPDQKKETTDTKELPTRLTHQFVRLAICIAAVLNKTTIDKEVLRRVRKVTCDTSRGITVDMMKVIIAQGSQGLSVEYLAAAMGHSEEKIRHLLRFLRRIGAVECYNQKTKGLAAKLRWRLTKRMTELFIAVNGRPAKSSKAKG